MTKIGNFIKTESRVENSTAGNGDGGNGKELFDRYRVSEADDENLREMDIAKVKHNLNMLTIPELNI